MKFRKRSTVIQAIIEGSLMSLRLPALCIKRTVRHPIIALGFLARTILASSKMGLFVYAWRSKIGRDRIQVDGLLAHTIGMILVFLLWPYLPPQFKFWPAVVVFFGWPFLAPIVLSPIWVPPMFIYLLAVKPSKMLLG